MERREDGEWVRVSGQTLAGMSDEPRRNAGGSRGLRLRTWKLRLKRIEDFAAEHGGEVELFRLLCEYVSGGGSIVKMCADHAVDIGVLLAWVRADAERSRRYDAAMADRKVFDNDGVRTLWTEVMFDERDSEVPTYGERLKASELLARNVGALRDGPGQSVHIHAGGNSLIAILSGIDAAQIQHTQTLQHDDSTRVIDVSREPDGADVDASVAAHAVESPHPQREALQESLPSETDARTSSLPVSEQPPRTLAPDRAVSPL